VVKKWPLIGQWPLIGHFTLGVGSGVQASRKIIGGAPPICSVITVKSNLTDCKFRDHLAMHKLVPV